MATHPDKKNDFTFGSDAGNTNIDLLQVDGHHSTDHGSSEEQMSRMSLKLQSPSLSQQSLSSHDSSIINAPPQISDGSKIGSTHDEIGSFAQGNDDKVTNTTSKGTLADSNFTTTERTGKRKRVVLSIHDKHQVLQRLDMGDAPVSIAEAFGISRQQVSDIKKNRARILSFCIDSHNISAIRRKTLKSFNSIEYHPAVEQELYKWLLRQRSLQREVTKDILSAKTIGLFDQYANLSQTNTYTGIPQPTSAKSISNWLKAFQKAHGIMHLTKDELDKLPHTFKPMMQTPSVPIVSSSQQAYYNNSSKDGISLHSTSPQFNSKMTNASGQANPYEPAQVNAISSMTLDDHTLYFRMNSGGVGNTIFSPSKLQTSLLPLQTTVSLMDQMNEQLRRVEHQVTIKLDSLQCRLKKVSAIIDLQNEAKRNELDSINNAVL